MDTSKRKLCSRKTRKIQTIKKRKVVKAKAELEQKKVPLKTIFKKVKNGDDGSSIYMIKDANEAPIQKLANPIDSDGKADITTNNDAAVESKATSSCRDTETPDFTTEDVAALIDCSDLAAFINFALDSDQTDEAVALLNLNTSTPVDNNLTTTVYATQPADIARDPFADRSIEQNHANGMMINIAAPTTQISNNEPLFGQMDAVVINNPAQTTQISNNERLFGQMDAISTQTVRSSVEQVINMTRHQCDFRGSDEFKGFNGVNMMDNQYANPIESNAWMYGQGVRSSDSECASEISPSTSYRFDETAINGAFSDRFNYATGAIPPARILEEILLPRNLTPSYRFRPISNTMFQCHVVTTGQSAYGTGTSKEHARNSAALSLLDKLVSVKFFGSNVIGQLQELCTAINWPLPKYVDEMAARTQMKNEFVFVVSCSVKRYKEFGQGRSKKMAKIFAAYKMWHRLTGKS